MPFLTLFPGRPCRISFRPDVAEGEAILTESNTIDAQVDSKILVQIGSKSHYLVVTKTTQIQNLANRDNIVIHGSIQSETGLFRQISERRYRLNKALGSRKARASLAALVLSVALAASASVNAAQHGASSAPACSGLHCVSKFTWVLIGLSAVAAIFGWFKDNVL
jgi:hypothetical protein